VDRADGTPLWETTVEARTANDPFPMSASDGDVVVFSAGGLVAVDAATGTVLWHEQAPVGTLGGASDGVFVTGGQDDELAGWETSTGARSWTGSGTPPYDDTWAIGDGAVFVVDRIGRQIVAHDLATGDVRWRSPWDPVRYPWPFHADDDTAYLLWWNVDAVSTDDGSPRWSTDFAPDGQHRFASVAANDDVVITNVTSRSPG
jgi:hypothetical protein